MLDSAASTPPVRVETACLAACQPACSIAPLNSPAASARCLCYPATLLSLLQAAYQFYTVPGATPLPQLMNDALILAHSTGHDVFNALDIFENEEILKGG